MADMSWVEGLEKELELQEVREAMKRMKNNRASGVSEVSIDMVKAREECLSWMTELLKSVWEEENILEDWSKSLIVPIFKKKGDVLECKHYRGIKLLEHGLKLFERVLERKIHKVVDIDPKQFGFMPGKSTVNGEENRRKPVCLLWFC